MPRPAPLPSDVESLQRLVREQQAQLLSRDVLIEQLKLQLARLKKLKFGHSSEQLDAQIAQLELSLEELESNAAANAPTKTIANESVARPVRKALPDHLPRVPQVHEPASGSCQCPECGGALRRLGEDTSEMLEYVPEHWKVIKHIRPKYSCGDCQTIVQAAAPSRPIERSYAGPGLLTLRMLSSWQAALFPTGRSGLVKIRVGALRGTAPMRIVSGPLDRQKVHYEAPPRRGLERELRRFLDWFNKPPADVDGVVRAGLAHAWFELIHPFEDGNGRVGRALLDRALAQDEHRSSRLYGLSARFMVVRSEYYDALQALSRRDLDVTDWLKWFLEQVLAACAESAGTVERVLQKARFWIHHSQSGFNQRQRKVLNTLLDAGADGFIGGMTNRKYAHLTHISPATAQRDLVGFPVKDTVYNWTPAQLALA
jgi:transposase